MADGVQRVQRRVVTPAHAMVAMMGRPPLVEPVGEPGGPLVAMALPDRAARAAAAGDPTPPGTIT